MGVNPIAVGVEMISVLADPVGAVEISEVGFPTVEVNEVALACSRLGSAAMEFAIHVSCTEAILEKRDGFFLSASTLIGHAPDRASRMPDMRPPPRESVGADEIEIEIEESIASVLVKLRAGDIEYYFDILRAKCGQRFCGEHYPRETTRVTN